MKTPPRGTKVMTKFKPILITALIAIVAVALYSKFIRPALPASIQSIL